MINFKKKATYDLVTITSMGLRISPLNNQPIHTSDLFRMQVTSAESNVLTLSAALGLKTKVLSKFMAGSIGQKIKNNLLSRHIEYEGKTIQQQSPFGYRHQINIVESGSGYRAPKVVNDRAGEVARSITYAEFDLEKLFNNDGVKLLHISGLFASLSKETGKACLDIIKHAKQQNTKVSFDINYRPSFWQGRESELKDIFKEIASLSDILIGNLKTIEITLDFNFKSKKTNQKMSELLETYPNLQCVATSERTIKTTNNHLFGSSVKTKEKESIIPQKSIEILDRIGGGDGFVGGLLYGLLKDYSIEKANKLGWANAVLTMTLENDYSQPINEQELWAIYEGIPRIKR